MNGNGIVRLPSAGQIQRDRPFKATTRNSLTIGNFRLGLGHLFPITRAMIVRLVFVAFSCTSSSVSWLMVLLKAVSSTSTTTVVVTRIIIGIPCMLLVSAGSTVTAADATATTAIVLLRRRRRLFVKCRFWFGRWRRWRWDIFLFRIVTVGVCPSHRC